MPSGEKEIFASKRHNASPQGKGTTGRKDKLPKNAVGK